MSVFRRLARQVLSADVFAPLFRRVGRGLLSIFTLHRFTDPALGVAGTDPATLRDYLAYLRRHRYRLLSMTDVLDLLDEGNGRLTAPAVAFTVDDGYDDFARIGAPIFAEYDCPVTLFVTTGFLDGQLWLWWDRVEYLLTRTRRSSLRLALGPEERPYRWSTAGALAGVQADVVDRLQWLDGAEREAVIAGLTQQLEVELPANPPPEFAPIRWDEVRRTARLGATFGPHTVTHRILSSAADEVCDWEIRESYGRLSQETDACVPVLCYPNGETRAVGRRGLEAAQRAGVKAALTTVPGYATPCGVRSQGALGRFALPRFPYPDDRAHLVHVVAGLARSKHQIRRGHPRPSDVASFSVP